jgi:hypothetical protein
MGYEYDKIQGNYPVVWLPDLPKSDKKVIKCPLFVIEVFQLSFKIFFSYMFCSRVGFLLYDDCWDSVS